MSILKYSKQLKDRRWQVLASKIKQRDKVCQMCGESKNLEVHHTCYEYDLMAWEYDEMYLITLCRGCHEAETDGIKSIKEWVNEALKAGMFAEEIKNKIRAAL